MPFLIHAHTVQGGQMPSVTESGWPTAHSSSTTKKRRREDGSDVQTSLATTAQAPESQNLLSTINNSDRLIFPSASRGPPTSFFNVPRKVVPLPVGKRFRLADENESRTHTHPSEEQGGGALPSGGGGGHSHHHHHQHPQQPSHFPHAHPDYSTAAVSSPPRPGVGSRTGSSSSSALLDPCHICHRKPTRKSDLDSFADCSGCGQRTCFVCIRACPGWLPPSSDVLPPPPPPAYEEEGLSISLTMRDVDDEAEDEDDDNNNGASGGRESGQQRQKKGEGGAAKGWSGPGHREVICSRCCVERGSEGDVVCLGCLAGMEGA
ncbi:hypothetical protein F4779DRAFT_580689 [Xylariaceae sp. FL0662B]|nr:hypothetical protein F4779DRAFT_580689 [Xylariaceae sp. FL0662B]